jgi:MAP/microtubule affinity-regulating kinase
MPPSHAENPIAGYVLGATIGRGDFSTIKLATAPSGGTVAGEIVRHAALNVLPPREKSRQRSRLSHEACEWISLSHENILPSFNSHIIPAATYLIVLYCLGSLLNILNREGTPALERTDAGCMFRQALRYLHEIMELVHGDVKLENVLVDERGVFQLADFGLSQCISGDSSQVSSRGEDDEDQPRERSKRSGASPLPLQLSLMRHGPQCHRNSSPLPVTATPTP